MRSWTKSKGNDMTIQLTTLHGKSKAALLAGLREEPTKVGFHDPSIMNERWFNAESIPPGTRFPVVMDHPRRSRFAEVERKADGTWRVT